VQLTLHADYSLRVLLYLAHHPEHIVTTQEVSDAYGISRNHLVRVMQTLQRHGWVELSSGRFGGARLTKEPAAIGLGAVVRAAEPGFALVECFEGGDNSCPITSVCRLKGVLDEALRSFLAVLDRHTLADLVAGATRREFEGLLHSIAPARTPRESNQ
jgi:Rrf2 family transcriptional regulator, nitric oxide-sensitive transcriptional repressor